MRPTLLRQRTALVFSERWADVSAEERSRLMRQVRRPEVADKFYKGAKPAGLPVEEPTKYELIINLKTAKTLGLTIPRPLVIRVDGLIQ